MRKKNNPKLKRLYWGGMLVVSLLAMTCALFSDNPLLALGEVILGQPGLVILGLVTTARSGNDAITEAVLERDIPDEVLILDGDQTPLLVMSINAKRRRATISPRIEKIEDDLRSLWGYHNAAAIDSVTTGVLVNDGTLFAVGDVVAVLQGATSSSVDELIRVTAISSNTLTVTRGVGTFKDTISASNALRIIGSAYAENAAYGSLRSTNKTTVTSYTQIFREPFGISGTQRATKTFGGPEEDYQERTALLNIKRQIEAAALWGKATESLASPGTIRTTMGFKGRVTTNVTDVNTTLTLTLMNTFGQTAFRYNYGRPRLFIAAPVYVSAINYFSQNKLLTEVGAKVFGVNIKRLMLPHGELLLTNNFNMEAGISGQAGFEDEAYAVDMANVEYRYLAANGVSRDIKKYMDVVKDGVDGKRHEYMAECGWIYTQEKSHSRLRECSAYS